MKKDRMMYRTDSNKISVTQHKRPSEHTGLTIRYDTAVSPNLAAEDASTVSAYPGVCRVQNTIVCVYRNGRAKHSRDGILLSQSSSDGGRSWSPPTIIFDRMKQAEAESVHVGVVCECDGVVLAFFKTVEAKILDAYIFSEEGRRLRQRSYVCRSLDAGQSWSESIEIELRGGPRDTYLGSRPLVLPSGRLFIPVEATAEHGQQMMMGCFSDDQGRSLSPLFPIAHDATGQRGFGDGKVTLLPDGRIVMLTWTYLNHKGMEETLRVHRCVSSDGGVSWSHPEPTNTVCQVMTPLSIGHDNLVAVGNIRTFPEGIRLFRSMDAGETWSDMPIQLWDARQLKVTGVVSPIRDSKGSKEDLWDALPSFTFGCPELMMLPDDDIVMTYYADLRGVTHIRACRFSLDNVVLREDHA